MNIFSKKDTNIVKGIAILAMVFHHLNSNNPGIPLKLEGFSDLTLLFATTGKVCVALLTILSGYGLTCSWEKRNISSSNNIIKKIGRGFLFSLEHYIQLLSMYWCVLLFAFICVYFYYGSVISVYGIEEKASLYFWLDVFGIGAVSDGPSLLGGWYLSAIVLLYFLFPIIYILVKKLKIFSVLVLYIPWVYYLIKQDYNMHTDWWLFYVYAFALGIYFAYNNTIVKVSSFFDNKKLLVLCLLALSVFIRAFVALPADGLVACAIILFAKVVINEAGVFGRALSYIGENSANIWLMHIFISMLLNDAGVIVNIGHYIIRVVICLGISILIESMKTAINYNGYVMSLRNRLMKIG
ncbi:Peptidoglycan/LPS O-acetylase OafA/YrhL, contains acyltransferase and SGNH-hydrolase domains [Pseudobutyrivibrio sp. NOR37]|uniref:Acyltransferase family protein n=1 Tax=Pseudobutyrivibrio xylanivorans TaxID=185007 RepID=A0A6M0LIK6_PSEXY|nr:MULTISPECIES: acyltransferase family protein [Pseudobutyrivibrio]NEX02322.1 acyltransferase family protein [Pseudobutyrivibrio xylanivorans]SFR78120.1 Peptidoglycan/LPS O-acetylase OafA/YrhL, contains acyltransferase and SGNH-hydrolase domains [Pseudobutyrivibrio sp. NOR37]